MTDTLRAIAEHAHCEACHLDFQLDFANSIELIFRVHPEIREADLGTYCIGGPAHSPHVLRPDPRRRRVSGSSWSSSCRRARTGCGARSCPGRPTSRSRKPPRFGAGISSSRRGRRRSVPPRCAPADRS